MNGEDRYSMNIVCRRSWTETMHIGHGKGNTICQILVRPSSEMCLVRGLSRFHRTNALIRLPRPAIYLSCFVLSFQHQANPRESPELATETVLLRKCGDSCEGCHHLARKVEREEVHDEELRGSRNRICWRTLQEHRNTRELIGVSVY